MADLKKLAVKLGTDGPVKTLATTRMIKLLFNGVYILQTTNAVFVWEHPFYPQFYVPRSELVENSKHTPLQLTEGDAFNSSHGKQVGTQLTLTVGDKSTAQAIAFSDDLSGSAEALRGLVKIDFHAIDKWFEEDTPMSVHPKDPFKRVDVVQSRRHIRVFVDGEVVADTTTSHHLYETMLPTRYYMPLTVVRPDVLRPSTTRTQCPYKGEAEYYSVEVNGKLHKDIVWFYNTPTLESALVAGLVCFYNEKVDIELDGQMLERADTHFGRGQMTPSAV
ncbi:hypothetical protein LTR36_009641 [Oleoguttula mirabilis]|uniref:DUF427 domain-containing protein n=1 Tax=Oleoguttula mirabilis TaxID=1507867 RepID=A0AAV9J5V3_9PEZI|nr:hypothetical protein LTR36_009641 [Oleoguttula mirabilis]